MSSALDGVRSGVRKVMHGIAVVLNKLSGGKLSPNSVTITSLVMHIPIAWLIATQSYIWAAVLLVVFGLFDALDGELARLQHRDSAAGMLLDASTDRMKEVILYIGAAYSLVSLGQPYASVWAVAACGASLCVSYVKAKGETAITKSSLSASEVNRLFQDGLMRYEVRMAVLIIGLLTNYLAFALAVITLASGLTAISRLLSITEKLNAQS